MQFTRTYARFREIRVILTLLVPILLGSCNATRFVPQGEYLLDSYKIESGEGQFDKKELEQYVKQKPNKRILIWRFYLFVYNLSKPDKDNGFNNWLRKIGEPPVVYDEEMKKKTSEQLMLFMRNKGYFDAEVTDTTSFYKRRANVYYRITPNTPYRVRDITYFFQDATLSSLILSDTSSSRLQKGTRYDVDNLQKEQTRIETVLKDSGYYNFDSKRFVYFEVDSALKSHQMDITLGVRNYPKIDERGRVEHVDHPVYSIRNVYLMTDYNAVSFRTLEETGMIQYDTVEFDSVFIIYNQKPNIRPSVVTQKNYIIPNNRYDASNVQRTYRNLTSLSAFNMVDIRFREVEGDRNRLDCDVLIVPATRQSYTVKVEGTNSGGNIGAAGNLSYRHRNLFGGSEQFDLTFKGAIETLKRNESEGVVEQDTGLNLMQEFGVEARLRIPKFLLPFKTDRFIRRYNPQTNLRLSYNYQKRPDYIRTLANASFGYDWRGSARVVHRVYPLEASLILTPFKRPSFQQWLEGKYLYYSYQPHLIINSRYSMIWSNQKLLKNQNFQDIRLNLETAGNLLNAGYTLFSENPGDKNYQLLGVDFAQYVKADIDLRSYYFLNENANLVLRGFAGFGFAYGNSTAMPFEKQYFSGGANSIRAWQVKNLGPGSYDDPQETTFPNQTGDVKLEANMEYRFKLVWKLEAALFMDVGNIWSLSAEDDRAGAGFELDRFYKELAVGTGIGARAVFSFFIFRFDLGVPLRNPFPLGRSNWLPGNTGITGQDLTFNLAIGYPF